jgi:2-polyprenyl-3-methyl-5-hydroxy-6-metoxy-1,4-benzoquinol methylase
MPVDRIANPSLELVACNLCGADDPQVLIAGKHKGRSPEQLVEDFGAFVHENLIGDLVNCKRCGFEYLTPRLSSELRQEAYAGSKDSTQGIHESTRKRNFAKQIEVLEKLLPGVGRLYDIGAGDGALACAAVDRGWEATGCEINEELVRFAQERFDVTLDAAGFDQLQPEESAYEAVTIWGVLEHLADPAGAVSKMARMLKPGGLLAIEVPDIGSIVARIMGRRWFMIMSAHLYYFDRKTLTRMVSEAGLEVISVKADWDTVRFNEFLDRLAPIYPKFESVLRTVTPVRATPPIPYNSGKTVMIARRPA